jgi:dolichol-phosphate mannosyltransferase
LKLSVVSPVYNEEGCIGELCRLLIETLSQMDCEYEIVLVDDGSADSSWAKISELSKRYPEIRGVRFSRNFGHHCALSAGLHHAVGDWIVVMDSDLQDTPSSIPDLLHKARTEGYDIVLARRMRRKFGWFKNFCSRMFYRVFRYLTGSKYDGEAGVYRIMSRPVVDAFCRLPEIDSFFPAMIDWVGFRQGSIYVTHGKRFAGETKYPLYKQITLAINAILSFSDKPILIVVYFGLGISAFSILYATYIVIRGLVSNFAVLGYASIITSIFFIGGVMIATLGLIGLYVGRIFRQVKGRPLYIVAELASHPAPARYDLPPLSTSTTGQHSA